MQTFVQKQKPATAGRSGNLQKKQSGHGYDAASSAGFEFTQPATAHLTEVERVLNDSPQANTMANYQNLFDQSPRVSSVNSQQAMAAGNPGVVAQAKFQNVLNNRAGAPQVAQLKPNGVVQRNGDGQGDSNWGKKLFLGGLGGYFAGTRAMAKHTADPLGRFGAEQGAGLFGMGDYVKGVNMFKYGQQIFKGGYPRYLAMAPMAVASAYMLSKLMSKKEHEK